MFVDDKEDDELFEDVDDTNNEQQEEKKEDPPESSMKDVLGALKSVADGLGSLNQRFTEIEEKAKSKQEQEDDDSEETTEWERKLRSDLETSTFTKAELLDEIDEIIEEQYPELPREARRQIRAGLRGLDGKTLATQAAAGLHITMANAAYGDLVRQGKIDPAKKRETPMRATPVGGKGARETTSDEGREDAKFLKDWTGITPKKRHVELARKMAVKGG